METIIPIDKEMKTFEIQIRKTVNQTFKVVAQNKEEAIKAIKNRKAIRIYSDMESEGEIVNIVLTNENKNFLKRDVHTEHCCLTCGCKYGKDNECTVILEKRKQNYPHDECE